jgi:flavin reductase (DIM6/NTAB) family NADH-FMN oxidoreductase RutF
MDKHIVFTAEQIASFDKQFRTNLINSVPGVKATCLVGTRNSEGVNNLAIFSSLVHIGANPPLLGLIFRPDSVERHTLSNIRHNQYYTMNLLHKGILAQAHQTAARYPADISEFTETGLNPVEMNGFHAPSVRESAVCMGMLAREELHINTNNTILLVGEICWLQLPAGAVTEDGFVNPERAGTCGAAGLDAYFSVRGEQRFSYAKPGLPLRSDPSFV